MVEVSSYLLTEIFLFALGSQHILSCLSLLSVFQKTEKTEFLGFFYKHSMHVLTAPLFANTADEKPSRGEIRLY